MPSQLEIGQELTIEGTVYRVAAPPEAPALPTPYVYEGQHSLIYHLLAAQESWALKVLHAQYRLPILIGHAERLASLQHVPGLRVAQRRVLSPQRHSMLLRRQPELAYSILMPWASGTGWGRIVREKQALTPDQSLSIARGLAEMLVELERRQSAHCDLTGSALIVSLPVTGGSGISPNSNIPATTSPVSLDVPLELVDLEQMYLPELSRIGPAIHPVLRHPNVRDSSWGPEADRFAGAVLLAEILGWHDPDVRKIAHGSSYFDLQDMRGQQWRYLPLAQVISARFGEDITRLLERAWVSLTLTDCPTFDEWRAALHAPINLAVSSTPKVGVLPSQGMVHQPAPPVQPQALPSHGVQAGYGPPGPVPSHLSATVAVAYPVATAQPVARQVASAGKHRAFYIAPIIAVTLLALGGIGMWLLSNSGSQSQANSLSIVGGATAVGLTPTSTFMPQLSPSTAIPAETSTSTGTPTDTPPTLTSSPEATATSTSSPIPTTPPTATPTPEPYAIVNTPNDEIRFREGPGVEYAITRFYPHDTRVTLKAWHSSREWMRVLTPDGRDGWMMTRWLTLPIDITSLPVESGPGNTVPIADAVVDTPNDSLNMRQGPSKSYPVLGKFVDTTPLRIIARTSDGAWLHVRPMMPTILPNAGEGWMETRWLHLLVNLWDVPVE